MSTPPDARAGELSLIERVVKIFLHSQLSLVLILLAVLLGAGALMITPREKDPQIIVPMIDIYVAFPGHSAKRVILFRWATATATPWPALLQGNGASISGCSRSH